MAEFESTATLWSNDGPTDDDDDGCKPTPQIWWEDELYEELIKIVIAKFDELTGIAQQAFSEQPFDEFFDDFFRNANVVKTMASSYLQLYEKSGALHYQDFYELIEQKCPVKTLVDKLFAAEKRWNDLLMDVDKKKQEQIRRSPQTACYVDAIKLTRCDNNAVITVGKFLAGRHFTIFVFLRFFGCQCCYGHLQRLSERVADFDRAGCQICIVCKGGREAAVQWHKLSGFALPVLLDHERHFAEHFHFGVSVYNSCSSKAMHSMAAHEATGRELYRCLVADAANDVHQLGGDVIVDSDGLVVFVHPCRSSTDRLTPDQLLLRVPGHVKPAPPPPPPPPGANRRQSAALTLPKTDHCSIS